MDRRTFIKTSGVVATQAALLSATSTLSAASQDRAKLTVVLNPYANINWQKIEQHKAAMHFHTIQSDGRHSVDDVVNAYRSAGFTILSITDHDTMEPNRHVKPSGSAAIDPKYASPYPKDPKPANYPANPTYPWNDYGCSSPENLGLVGIEGNELSDRKRHHTNSYFNDSGYKARGYNETGWYGDVSDEDNKSGKSWDDYQLDVVKEKGGLARLCHPGWSPLFHRKPLEWYIDIFRNHSSDCLLGMEITNHAPAEEPYDFGLWDQLLVRFMPNRPIWGFGGDDMHLLERVKQTFDNFLLPSLSAENTRKAMLAGEFVVCKSTRQIDYRQKSFKGLDTFPTIEKITVDNDEGTISIAAKDCDEIRWISAPESLETIADYKTSNSPWHRGRLVSKGKKIDFRAVEGIKNYLRAELIRKDGKHTQTTYTNPFGLRG